MRSFHVFFLFIVILRDLLAQDCGNLPTDWRNPERGPALEPVRIGMRGLSCLLYLSIIREAGIRCRPRYCACPYHFVIAVSRTKEAQRVT